MKTLVASKSETWKSRPSMTNEKAQAETEILDFQERVTSKFVFIAEVVMGVSSNRKYNTKQINISAWEETSVQMPVPSLSPTALQAFGCCHSYSEWNFSSFSSLSHTIPLQKSYLPFSYTFFFNLENQK